MALEYSSAAGGAAVLLAVGAGDLHRAVRERDSASTYRRADSLLPDGSLEQPSDFAGDFVGGDREDFGRRLAGDLSLHHYAARAVAAISRRRHAGDGDR